MIIKIALLLNQYHGNAWHHAHCEGLIDWPPAPWRILRAIVAGSYNVNFSSQQGGILKSLLWKMAQVLPTYYLPPTAYLQWRSPRPQVRKDASIGPGKNLYSACLLVPDDDSAIYCNYDINCSEEELSILEQAMAGITYLGRRESPAVWHLAESMPSPTAYPDPTGLRTVAVPSSSLTEDELWDGLNLSAAEVFQHRKQAVFPGLEQATYKLDPLILHSEADRRRILPKRVLLSVEADIKVGASRAIALCEALHQRLAKAHPEPIFTGMEMGEKIGSHNHAFLTPVPDLTGRWIEYIELYSHQGFSPTAIHAIAQMDRVWAGGWVRLNLTDFAQSSESYLYWQSTTPMFLSRYPVVRNGKPRRISGTSYQKDCAEHQALKYLRFLPQFNWTGEVSFEELPTGLGMKVDSQLVAACRCEVWIGAGKLLNGKHGKLSVEQGFNVWMEFASPVCAPISLGYRCHYGFGSLAPVRGWVGVEQPISQNAYAVMDMG